MSSALVVTAREVSERSVVYTVEGQDVTVTASRGGARAVGDAEVALGLVPALRAGRAVQIDRPLTTGFSDRLQQLQEIFGSWLDRHPVHVEGPAPEPLPHCNGVGAFFSGGVDSFYTALTHLDELDALIFVHGFDIPVDDNDLGEEALRHARAAAAALGKELIEVRTDLRNYRPVGNDWGFTHGAAMALVAHTLSGHLGKVYIPATYTYRDMFPWGSHPMTDPLWSGATTMVHDGAHVTRLDKLAYLADQPIPAEHLRVCWENRGGRFNCCECEKCTRTMIALRSLGALNRFRTFDRPLNLNKVRFGVLRDTAQKTFTRQVLRQLDERGTDPDLADALRWRLRIGPVRNAVVNTPERLYRRLDPQRQQKAKAMVRRLRQSSDSGAPSTDPVSASSDRSPGRGSGRRPHRDGQAIV
ncbi:hypothetical protein FHU33_4646 [Blastococcus colisei]|uniref:7-cyano-7-deazaguanine synthase in queuosine biosynthesis n=1 Tax=Blastococcus colisei TaxID=1564162 RepID=A0A543P1M3_9ACTN|nr:hypothetical protein [Blastococcus colisei]TQN37969.1 hypothetical protein FHU33_4646 [Blastococcus colisei]